MNELIKLFANQGLIFPLQAIILIIDVLLFTKGKANIYIIYSALIIFSIFVLQLVRRRFLLLFPSNSTAGCDSSHIDTYYLRIIAIISTFLTIIGLVKTMSTVPPLEQNCYYKLLPFFALILIVIVPGIFWFFSENLNQMIANKLKKKGPNKILTVCNYCGKSSCIQENYIIDKNTIKIKRKCHCCQKEEPEYEVFTNIGE